MLVTASDRVMAIGKWSHRLVQLAYASNEPKDTIPRRHGGPRRPLQDGPKWPPKWPKCHISGPSCNGRHGPPWRRGMVSLGSFDAYAS